MLHTDHLGTWLVQVLVPYVILLSGFLLMKGGGRSNLARKAFDLGFEACILGVGLSAALLASKEAPTGVAAAGLVAAVVGVLIIVIYYRMKSSRQNPISKATFSIVISTFICGANTAILSWIHHPDTMVRPLLLGATAWVLPCIVFNITVRKYSL
jgi:hypothetical protein